MVADKPEPIREVAAHDGWARMVDASPDGSLIATAGNDRKVKLWNFADGSLVQEFVGHDCHVYNVLFHPDGKSLVSGDLKANLIHWNIETGEQVRKMTAEALCKYDPTFLADIGGFRGLAFDATGTRLVGSGITNVTNAFAGIGNPAIVVYDWETAGVENPVTNSKAKLQGVGWGVVFSIRELCYYAASREVCGGGFSCCSRSPTAKRNSTR